MSNLKIILIEGKISKTNVKSERILFQFDFFNKHNKLEKNIKKGIVNWRKYIKKLYLR